MDSRFIKYVYITSITKLRRVDPTAPQHRSINMLHHFLLYEIRNQQILSGSKFHAGKHYQIQEVVTNIHTRIFQANIQ
jgi:hypothetical protein